MPSTPPPFPPAEVQEQLGVAVSQYLGGGAFRRVFAAAVTATGEEVALASEALGAEQQTDVAVMARVTSDPPHPHVIGPPVGPGITPMLISGGRCFTVLQRMDRETFDLLGMHGGAVPEDVARTYFAQMCAGLRFLHAHGVGHRDLKLENMMLSHDGIVKLIDFGLAHVAPMPQPLHAAWNTTARGSVGTKSYQAPELLLGLPYDALAADVWSLGCCLFALVNGFFIVDRPHPSDPRFARIQQACAAGHSPVRAIFALYARPCHLSDDLVQLLDGMFAVRPNGRLTLEEVVACPWLVKAYAPHRRMEETYRTDVLNRRRAAERWARLTAATLGFGRALTTLGGMLQTVRAGGGSAAAAGSAGGHPGADGGGTASSAFGAMAAPVDIADDDLDELMPPVAPASGGGLGSWAAPFPQLFRSFSGGSAMSDDEMGPPVYRSARAASAVSGGVQPPSPLTRGLSDVLEDTFRGLSEAVAGVQPPPVVKQQAQRC